MRYLQVSTALKMRLRLYHDHWSPRLLWEGNSFGCWHKSSWLLPKIFSVIGNFFICSIAVRMVFEIIVMNPLQETEYRGWIDIQLVLLIGGNPIANPTFPFITMAIGLQMLSQ